VELKFVFNDGRILIITSGTWGGYDEGEDATSCIEYEIDGTQY